MTGARPSVLKIIGPPILTLLALLVLLSLTTGYAFFRHAPEKGFVSLAIAGIKAGIVMAIFMRLTRSSALVRLTALTGFAWLGILMTLGWIDFVSRLS